MSRNVLVKLVCAVVQQERPGPSERLVSCWSFGSQGGPVSLARCPVASRSAPFCAGLVGGTIWGTRKGA